MNRIRSAICALLLVVGTASAATISQDGFEDGSYNNLPSSSTNPNWQVLLITGLNTGHDQRWDVVTDASAIAGNSSARWKDTPCEPQLGLQGECFPAGVLYTDPTPNRPGQVGTYFVRLKTKIEQVTTPLNPLPFGSDKFVYASGPGALLYPPNASGLVGGYAAGLVYNAGPSVSNPADDKIEAGILYLEGNIQTLELKEAVLLRASADIPIADFFSQTHDIQMTVRSNRYIELTVDGKYYGRADTAGSFTDPSGSTFTPSIPLSSIQDVAMVGLAGNENRYDSVEYNNTPPADANRDGIPDIFQGASTADPDSDCDGIRDSVDPDTDDDGVPNFKDTSFNNPTDSNGDGVPEDMDVDGVPDLCDADVDGDGCPNARDVNPNPNPPDCNQLCTSGPALSSFDCDEDGVSNDCEEACTGGLCDPTITCDSTPPSITFVHPARGSYYAQDSMALLLHPDVRNTTFTSLTVKVRIEDSGSGVNPTSVQFLVDGNPVPASVTNPAELPYYSFRYDASGQDGEHQIAVTAKDLQGNASGAQTELFVVDATAVTGMIATDVTDQYAVVIEPVAPSIGVPQVGIKNLAAIQPQDGFYTFSYRVMDYETLIDSSGTVVPFCHSNVIFVIDTDGAVNGMTTSGAFPGFWHDPTYTLANASVSCSGNTSTASFANGVYTVKIPAAAIGSRPVGLWAYVDVQDRASTNGPGGSVDSAAGFYNPLKATLADNPAADRLDDVPGAILLLP